jgi:F0F1-type ATP synthase membrane subunit b/b'
MYRILLFVSSALLCVAIFACGGESDSPGKAAGTSAPAAAPEAAASVQQISAEAKQCLDLVRKKLYVEAVDPCQRAVQDTGNADVKRAYDEAVAAVQREAQDAAVKAAAESLSGKPADEAAKDAASDALGGLGADKP